MSNTVRYVGPSDARRILRTEILAAGLPDPGIDLVWDKANGFTKELPAETAAFVLAVDQGFLVDGLDYEDLHLRGALKPEKVPQLKSTPITLHGHSGNVQGSWTPNAEMWANRFPTVADTGAITNQAVGGTTMEYAAFIADANPAGVLGAFDWGYPSTKTLMLVHDTGNSAAKLYFQAGNGITEEIAVYSFRESVRFLAAMTVSDRIHATASGTMVYTGAGWQNLADPASSSGTVRWTPTAGDYVTWTPASPVSYAWLVGYFWNYDFPTDSTGLATVTVAGDTVFDGPIQLRRRVPAASSAADQYDYGKVAIPIGPVGAGQAVRMTKGLGLSMFFDGVLTLNAKHHACFIRDVADHNNVALPQFDPSKIRMLNQVIDEVKYEFDLIAPDLMSVAALDAFDDYDHTTMAWSGDGLHANSKGQSWYLARITQELARVLPWTPRLQTI